MFLRRRVSGRGVRVAPTVGIPSRAPVAPRRRFARPVGRAGLLIGCVLGVLRGATPVRAEDPSVPIDRQVALLVKVAAYDRNLARRAGPRVNVVIVARQDTESQRVAAAFRSALADVRSIAGLAHDEHILAFDSPAALAEACKWHQIAIAVLTPGLDDEAAAIGRALDGGDVLTVTGSAAAAARGVVLGFDLVSGHPRMVINLGSARRQHVDFAADVLRLAKVIE